MPWALWREALRSLRDTTGTRNRTSIASAVISNLTERALAYVRRAEPAISGQVGHAATMKVARTLVSGFCLPADDAMQLLHGYNSRCLPPWSNAELAHKLRSALATPSPHPPGWMLQGNNSLPPNPTGSSHVAVSSDQRRPIPWDQETLKKVAGDVVITPRRLAEKSPVAPAHVTPGAYLAHVFEPGQKAIIFTKQQSQGQSVWPDSPPPRAGPEGVWFLIQPIDGLFHENPRQGNLSRRSEESVTQWRHMLLESDEAPRGAWLGAMCRLPLPIVSIASSGNRSLHVLSRLEAETKRAWDEARREMLRSLSRLGCDAAAMTAVRLARLPGCLRQDKAAKQTLFYLNPAPAAAPLFES